jgi:predicted ester cyclase
MGSIEASKRVVTAFLAAITDGDDAAVDRLVSEEGLKVGIAVFRRAFPDHAIRATRLLAAEDDHVVAWLVGSGTHLGPLVGFPTPDRTLEPTGRRWESSFLAVYRLTEGRVSNHWVGWPWLEILDQLDVDRD